MKKRKKNSFILILVLILVVGFGNVGESAGRHNKKNNFVMENTENSYELKKVVKQIEYPKSQTSSKKWKKGKNKKYEYPVDYDNMEWKKYKNHTQMIEVCTVPDDVVKNATTEELLDLVLNYPLLCDIFAYNSCEEGVAAVASQFNAFGELINRDDVSDIFLQRYLETEIKDATADLEKNFDKVSEVVVLETVLAQEDIVDELTDEEQDELTEAIEENIKVKEQTNLFQDNIATFYEVSKKNGVSKKLKLKEYRVDKSEKVNASSSIYVKTPNGTKVEVQKNKYKGSSWAESLDKEFKNAYPKATFLSSSDNRYNCHSYAWYSASTSNRYWMSNPKAYVSDGSYKYVGTTATASSQKVVYKYQKVPNDMWIHSGISVNKTGTIKSKWGQGPLMQHMTAYCPYFGQYNVVQYYKKK